MPCQSFSIEFVRFCQLQFYGKYSKYLMQFILFTLTPKLQKTFILVFYLFNKKLLRNADTDNSYFRSLNKFLIKNSFYPLVFEITNNKLHLILIVFVNSNKINTESNSFKIKYLNLKVCKNRVNAYKNFKMLILKIYMLLKRFTHATATNIHGPTGFFRLLNHLYGTHFTPCLSVSFILR